MTTHVYPDTIIRAMHLAAPAQGQTRTDAAVAYVFSLNPTAAEIEDAKREISRPIPDVPLRAPTASMMDKLNVQKILDKGDRDRPARRALKKNNEWMLNVLHRVTEVIQHSEKLPGGEWRPEDGRAWPSSQ
jgi:hypothetical protein